MGNNNCCLKNSDGSLTEGDNDDIINNNNYCIPRLRQIRQSGICCCGGDRHDQVANEEPAAVVCRSKKCVNRPSCAQKNLRSSGMLPPLSQSKKLPKVGLASSQDLADRHNHESIFLKQMNNLWTDQSNKEVSLLISQ